MQKYQLPGPAANWSPGPFDDHDRRAGIDRSFRINVKPGSEGQLVQRLAPHAEDFDWVQLDWRSPTMTAATPPGQSGNLRTLTPSDPGFGSQLNLQRANIQRAWDRTVSFSQVVIAVIDTGLRETHQDSGVWKQYTGWDYVEGHSVSPGTGVDSGCDGGHGTHVASIAAGDTNNGVGVAGAGFNSGILPMRAIYGAACDQWAPSTRDWPIRWAYQNGALVINMSYYNALPDPDESAVMQEAWNAGITPVAAAGNQGQSLESAPAYPCKYLYVVCVGANDHNGSWCSNSGYSTTWVDVSAEGTNSYAAGSASDSTYFTDSCFTSWATPVVSGTIALLRSLGYTPQQQFDALSATARPNGWTTFGEIDAGAALWH